MQKDINVPIPESILIEIVDKWWREWMRTATEFTPPPTYISDILQSLYKVARVDFDVVNGMWFKLSDYDYLHNRINNDELQSTSGHISLYDDGDEGEYKWDPLPNEE